MVEKKDAYSRLKEFAVAEGGGVVVDEGVDE
jgi:hypothetical protein